MHICLGITIAVLLDLDLIGHEFLFLLTAVGIIASILLKRHVHIPLFSLFIERLQRQDERERLPLKGAISYLLGSAIAVLAFPKTIAITSILILAFGDSISRLVGPYGNLKHPFNSEKFIEGIFTGWLAATLIAWQFVPLLHAAFAAGGAMVLEGLEIRVNGHKVDDNLTIPLVTGIIMIALPSVLI